MTGKKPQISKEKIAICALELAAERGWDRISLADIAKALKISLSVLHSYCEDKADILAAFGRMVDKIVLENADVSDTEASPRDRLFDILMERFDALAPYRAGVSSVLKSFCTDPKQAVIACPHLARSMAWMLEAAGLDTNGIPGALRVVGLTAVYLKVLSVWKDDESADLSKTMAALDRDLGRAEKMAAAVGF